MRCERSQTAVGNFIQRLAELIVELQGEGLGTTCRTEYNTVEVAAGARIDIGDRSKGGDGLYCGNGWEEARHPSISAGEVSAGVDYWLVVAGITGISHRGLALVVDLSFPGTA